MIKQYYSTHSGADIDATIELAKASKTRIDRNESAIGDLNNLNLRNDGHSLVTAVNTVNSGVEGGWVPFRGYDSLKFGNKNGTSYYCPSWELETGQSKSLMDYLSVGMKIRMKQDGIINYFFITAITDTGVTLFSGIGTGYQVKDVPMQALSYSIVESPYGFPGTFRKINSSFVLRTSNEVGLQTVYLGFRPNFLRIDGCLGNLVGYTSIGTFDGIFHNCIYKLPGGGCITDGGHIVAMHTGGSVFYAVAAFTDFGFTLSWTKIGDVPNGIVTMIVEAR